MEKCSFMYEIKILEKYIAREFIRDLKKEITPPTPTQMQIMEYILKHESEIINQKDLENVLNLRRATVSGVLQTMEKNHLIKRITDEEDARQKRIILHEDAKKCFRLHLKKVQEIEKHLMQNISEEEQIAFLNIIKKMQNNLKERTKEHA